MIEIKIAIPKKRLSFWVALFISLAAAASIYFAAVQLFKPVTVVVPKKAIDAMTVITDKDVELRTVSLNDKHPSAISNIQQVIGKYTDVRLYPGEQILSDRVTNNPGQVSGAFRFLQPDETYITLRNNEAKWPRGLKSGDILTAVAVVNGQTVKVAERLKVIASDEDKSPVVIKQVQETTSPGGSGNLTLSIKWNQVGPFYEKKSVAKELTLLPEHPNKEQGGELYEQPPQPSSPVTTGKVVGQR